MLYHWLSLCAIPAALALSIANAPDDGVDSPLLETRASDAKPIAAKCGPNTANIVCVDNPAVFPPSFFRDANPAVPYAGVSTLGVFYILF